MVFALDNFDQISHILFYFSMKCFFKTHPFQIGSYNKKEFVVFISLVGTEGPLR